MSFKPGLHAFFQTTARKFLALGRPERHRLPGNPMLQLSLWRRNFDFELRQIAERAGTARAAGNRVANQQLLDSIGLTLLPENNDAYYAEALDYHLGLIHGFLGDPEKAAQHFEQSRTLPGCGGDLVFSEHLAHSSSIAELQTEAVDRGMPPILLASMPRSASATLTQTVASTLRIAVPRVSAGRFPNYFLVPVWLRRFLCGGAITHDHFSASPYNLDILKRNSVRHLFVLARDPRASAASFVQFRSRVTGATLKDSSAVIAQTALGSYIPWLRQWLQVAKGNSGMKIKLLKSDVVRADVGTAVRKIFAILEPEYPALMLYSRRRIEEVRANFVLGDDDAWRKIVVHEDRTKMWDAIPDEMRTWLELEP